MENRRENSTAGEYSENFLPLYIHNSRIHRMADSILRNTISHLAAGVYRFKREKERNYSLNTAFANRFRQVQYEVYTRINTGFSANTIVIFK